MANITLLALVTLNGLFFIKSVLLLLKISLLTFYHALFYPWDAFTDC